MNPRLVKFAVELQNGDYKQETKKYINFKNSGDKKFFNFFSKIAKVTVPISKNI